MRSSDNVKTAAGVDRLDRPSEAVPSVDRPWQNADERAHRLSVLSGDRSTHRAHHGLYEDMLN